MVVTSAARNVIALVALLCAAGCKDARPEQVVEPDLRRVNGEIADDILRAVSDTPPGSPAAFTVGLHAQGDSVSFSPSCRNTLHRSLREQLRVLSQATKLEWRESPPAEATVAFIVSSDGVEQSR
ncbi:MAG TPA: hypothetical protein VK630_13570, partial [Reyranella sp.]|nr:hypothetical protein [Reyranella sp.]